MKWTSSTYESCDRYSNNIFDSVAQYEMVPKGEEAKYEAIIGKAKLKKRFDSMDEAKEAVRKYIVSECEKIINDCQKDDQDGD
jgi:hypothetical protein